MLYAVLMPDPTILIPVANHFFSPDALKSAVADAIKDHPGKNNVLKGTVDSTGAQVVLGLSGVNGNWTVQTAFKKDWQGSYSFGASGSVAW